MNKTKILLLLSFILIVLTTPLFSAKSPVVTKSTNPAAKSKLEHPIADNDLINNSVPVIKPKTSLGSTAPNNSPGVVIGNTWYDGQQLGSMGRMIEAYESDTMTAVHMSWMYLPSDQQYVDRAYKYNSYNLTNQTWGATGSPQDTAIDYGGFVGISVTNDNRAVIGGHNKTDTGSYSGDFTPHFWWDSEPLSSSWIYQHRVAHDLHLVNFDNDRCVFPKFCYVEGPVDTVLHVVGIQSNDYGSPTAIIYFRRVGAEDNFTTSSWDDPAFVIDTIKNTPHDLEATDDGKVAIVWTAGLPCKGGSVGDPSGDYETCDQNTHRDFWRDNDVWYMTSDDYGVSWNERVNVTNYIDGELEEDEYRAYEDMSALIDQSGNLHIVWGGSRWPTNVYTDNIARVSACRIFHWSENWPYIRTVHDADWDQTGCDGTGYELNAAKMTISECRGKFYVIFTQFNDIPNGIDNDCSDNDGAAWHSDAANGEL